MFDGHGGEKVGSNVEIKKRSRIFGKSFFRDQRIMTSRERFHRRVPVGKGRKAARGGRMENSERHDGDEAGAAAGRASEDRYEWRQRERGESDRYREGKDIKKGKRHMGPHFCDD